MKNIEQLQTAYITNLKKQKSKNIELYIQTNDFCYLEEIDRLQNLLLDNGTF